MKNLAQDEFNQLFLDLDQWKDRYREDPSIGQIDSFVRICLSIVRVLVKDERLMRDACKELSFIIASPQDLVMDVSEPLVISEHGIEENLRGVMNLWNWVLEDSLIRQDPTVMLSRVPGVEMDLRLALSQLASELFVYLDLDDAFAFNAARVQVVLFLLSISSLFDELVKSIRNTGEQVITVWLSERVKNQGLQNLFAEITERPSLEELADLGGLRGKELWLIAICRRAASGTSISDSEGPLWDRALNELGMFGLLPMVESGVFTLERDVHSMERAEKIPLRLFRIK
ncbi:MAG TPA: hypothetical protein VEL47_00295 [Myxococcota bacterium]|nr:hypothetical protein [Myxococcota bacterium]